MPWDSQVSRQHVRLQWNGEVLEVTTLEEARNPVYFRGLETPQFALRPGEHFVIGQTTFTLADQRVSITAEGPKPVQQQAFSANYLKQIQFRNPDRRIEVLSRLPDVISGAAGDAELVVRLVSMLLAGIPRADSAAVVAIDGNDNGNGASRQRPPVGVLHWDQRLLVGSDFQPSQRLILEAIRQRQSVLHVWRGAQQEASSAFTESENVDWAFCTPVLGKSSAGWGLYMAGRFDVETSEGAASSDPHDLREDVKFTELVAATLSSLRQMRLLEHQHATFSQFFSPVVLETLAVEDPEVVLAPRETEVSVMFCDLRGFSRESERHGDDLLGLLQRVSKALGAMTRHIREQGGVVGDFHGDAAMGFWGWPLKQDDAVPRTCRAALAVRKQFEATAGFQAGIGIATGKAVAGKIGTVDQVKVTVFGPVVNLAARLESMTKMFQAAVLVDEPTARAIREQVPPDAARLRRVARVKPFGLDTSLMVSELLPPESECPDVTDQQIAVYESALDAFLGGNWSEAVDLLARLSPKDHVKDFLVDYINRHNGTPPADWEGLIVLQSK